MNPAKTERRRHSLVLFAASLLASVVIWLWVQVSNSTEVAYTIPLLDRNLDDNLVMTTKLQPITVEARGPSEDLDKIDKDKLRAYIDLRNVSPTNNPNEVLVNLDRSGTPLSIVWTLRTPRVHIEVLPRVQEPRVVVSTIVGNPEKGYSFGPVRIDPPTIDLAGLQSEIDKVATVQAFIDASEAKRGDSIPVSFGDRTETNKNSRIRLLDSDGKEIVANVSVTPKTVVAHVEYIAAAPKKYLPIVPTWAGQLPTGYRFSRDHALFPSQLQVSGDAQTLSGITSLETEPINLTNLKQTRTFATRIRVPKGVRLEGADGTVKVTVFVQPTPAPTVGTASTGGGP